MNNIHSDSPAIMADGRTYSNWQPCAVINENIRKRENINTNWDYRNYLQSNANSIMSLDRRKACEQTGCTPIHSKLALTPQSDLQKIYLSRQQLQHDIVITPSQFN
jgi:hypothetical protein